MQFIISANGRTVLKAGHVERFMVSDSHSMPLTAYILCYCENDERRLDYHQLTHAIPEAEARVILEEIVTRLADGAQVIKVADLVVEYCE